MKKTIFPLLVVALALVGCKPHAVSASGEAIAIDSTLDAIADTAYLEYLDPIKADLEAELNVPLGTILEPMKAERPESNLLNWSADALLEMARLKSGQDVDMAVTNIGGLRCEWQAGYITFRHVFELMPFDNQLVILSLTGQDLLDLADCFAQQGGQGMSGMRLTIKDGKATDVTLGGHQIVPQMIYQVATSDYLSGGNDHLEPLANYSARWNSGEKIRDLYIEYIRLHPNVVGVVDGRTKISDK